MAKRKGRFHRRASLSFPPHQTTLNEQLEIGQRKRRVRAHRIALHVAHQVHRYPQSPLHGPLPNPLEATRAGQVKVNVRINYTLTLRWGASKKNNRQRFMHTKTTNVAPRGIGGKWQENAYISSQLSEENRDMTRSRPSRRNSSQMTACSCQC